MHQTAAALLSSPYIVWFGVTVLQAVVLVLMCRHGNIHRFWQIQLYFAAGLAVSLMRYLILHWYGLSSVAYTYTYYYSDTLLSVFEFAIVLRLLAHIFGLKAWNGIPIRFGPPFFFGIAVFAYAIVGQSQTKLVTRFVVEFGQDLFWMGLLSVVVLWIFSLAKKMRASTEVNLVWIFLIYHSILVASYFWRNLTPASDAGFAMVLVPELSSLWLVAGTGFIVLAEDPNPRSPA